MKSMRSFKGQQSGFTLVEIAIVLVIIGLLLGGILKGQELINSAKVKSFAQDFRNIQTALYGYQDKFKALPGDDRLVGQHIGGICAETTAGDPTTSPCYASTGPVGNGLVNGNWNSTTASDESFRFWQHLRAANLLPGPTTVTDSAYIPVNSDGGIIGLSSATTGQLQISGMTGTYQICSQGILGKFVTQLDIQLDDGNTAGGSMRAVAVGAALGTAGVALGTIDPALGYIVCMTF